MKHLSASAHSLEFSNLQIVPSSSTPAANYVQSELSAVINCLANVQVSVKWVEVIERS